MRHLPGPVFVFLVDEPGRRLRGYFGYPGLPIRPYRTAIPSVVVRTAPRVTEAEAIERGWISPVSDAMADAEEHIWTPGPRPLVCADIIVATAMLKARFPGGGWRPDRGEILGEFHGRRIMLRWTGEGWTVNDECVDGDPVVAFGTWAEKTFN